MLFFIFSFILSVGLFGLKIFLSAESLFTNESIFIFQGYCLLIIIVEIISFIIVKKKGIQLFWQKKTSNFIYIILPVVFVCLYPIIPIYNSMNSDDWYVNYTDSKQTGVIYVNKSDNPNIVSKDFNIRFVNMSESTLVDFYFKNFNVNKRNYEDYMIHLAKGFYVRPGTYMIEVTQGLSTKSKSEIAYTTSSLTVDVHDDEELYLCYDGVSLFQYQRDEDDGSVPPFGEAIKINR